MKITEVRIKLMDRSDDRLQAFCSITLDDAFVVRDLKIIEGSNGPFVAMPSRKLMTHCPECGFKNHLRACYCNQCGVELPEESLTRDQEGRAKLYADIAHPVNAECREMIQSKVIQEFHLELERAKQPGYVSRYDEEYPGDGIPPAINGAAKVLVSEPTKSVAKPSATPTAKAEMPQSVASRHRIDPEPAIPSSHRNGDGLLAGKKTPARTKSQFGEGLF